MRAMSINVRLPDGLAPARRVDAVVAEPGTSVEAAAVDLLDAALSESEHKPVSNGVSRHLAFAAIGASGRSRGPAHVDELLADGFGRDRVLLVDTGPLFATADRNDTDHQTVPQVSSSRATRASHCGRAAPKSRLLLSCPLISRKRHC